ncbi:NADH-quinone oxidoreductase subunit M [Granulosicoccus antarcticus]|uniref:NADH-quinone oxidoreductase subunit M n=1 Tax=Granulosicoccus antarcticus IMCC3135 TaxID=1192854 RepID=A0A2Z2NLV5_9GAMM|nr:NADH-quinone oxidoreductase subunit M [Granulosicoccus antarcticus]ASJ72316.1 NADH-quinone oxidoreductase subunit M [Granulosicoccus antarcticus IMCC3135]
MSFPILSLTIWLPILAGVLIIALGDRPARKLAGVASILTLLASLPLYFGFDSGTAEMQFQESLAWLPSFNINYALGVDGISMPLIILTTMINVIVVISAWQVIKDRPAMYLGAFSIMTGLMVGVFSSLDAMLFYIFFEATLIPMFLIIGIWGGPKRVYATVKFFLYTFLGSVFMLIALIYMYKQGGSFSILSLHDLPLNQDQQYWIFLAFLAAFAVKIPMWPVHTWLPDAHVEAPTAGSAVLAAVMLKMGGYGFLRFSLPITPDASAHMDTFMIVISLVAVVYIGFVALAQRDMKKLIAYSSISHMGFVTLGIFIAFRLIAKGDDAGVALGLEGAMIQMISHGFISAAMFLCVGVMYDRVHSREIADYGGVINTMPIFAAFMVFFAMANAGLPGTSGFVGEFMVILASFKTNFWIAFLASLTLILGAAYTLWMVKRVIMGPIGNDKVAALTDINSREFWMLALLAMMVLLIGVWPNVIGGVMHASVENLVQHISTSKY